MVVWLFFALPSKMDSMNDVVIRQLINLIPYNPLWKAMQTFTAYRKPETIDEIWLLEHESVFTQGLAGKPEHLLKSQDIPVIRTDRGGQITYHGPGQLVVYLLFDLNRLGCNTRTFVRIIEDTIVKSLLEFRIQAQGREGAPGVYVNNKKICSIGLRIRKNFSYHGLALNVAMDLKPFSFINPCGFEGLVITQIQDYVSTIKMEIVKKTIISAFLKNFGYNQAIVMKKTPLELLINDHLRSFSKKSWEREIITNSN